MSRHLRILTTTSQPPPPPTQVDPTAPSDDFVVILAALLCALICVLGLIAVARCSWIRRISGITITGGTRHARPVPGSGSANKGLKKKILKTLPKVTYSPTTVSECDYKVSDCCAICLTEFEDGDEIRVLPTCKHVFHVTCIDTWFGSHSSCPSCRQILTPAPRCRKCGELPFSPAEVAGERFLP
ncbi:RING-H2 finger protein ATL8-like protein [Tanacetum coccineum]